MTNTTFLDHTGTLQNYSVTTNGTYQIVANGAAGGNAINVNTGDMYQGNMGASLGGSFNLTAGTELSVVVGGVGLSNYASPNGPIAAGGGGGGTFVYEATGGIPKLFLVAGGGGGAGLNIFTTPGSFWGTEQGLTFVTPIQDGFGNNLDTGMQILQEVQPNGLTTSFDWMIAGTGGTGLQPGAGGRVAQGGAASSIPYQGAGGGGWITAGGSSSTDSFEVGQTPSVGGGGFVDGFVGGSSGKLFGQLTGGDGGYGGGGAGANNGGGGGGGYSGGGGGGDYGYGGDGGCYIASSTLYEIEQPIFNAMGNGMFSISLIREALANGSMIAYDTGAGQNAGELARLYEAAFGRAPDEAGLGYWISQLDAGAPLNNIATQFLASSEYQTLYGSNVSNTQFITQIYNGILDRAPDVDGQSYWLQQLANGMSRAQVLVSISESAEAVDNIEQTLLANGIYYQQWNA